MYHIALLYIHHSHISYCSIVHSPFTRIILLYCTFTIHTYHIALLYIHHSHVSYWSIVHSPFTRIILLYCTFTIHTYHIPLLYIHHSHVSYSSIVHSPFTCIIFLYCTFPIHTYHIPLLYIPHSHVYDHGRSVLYLVSFGRSVGLCREELNLVPVSLLVKGKWAAKLLSSFHFWFVKFDKIFRNVCLFLNKYRCELSTYVNMEICTCSKKFNIPVIITTYFRYLQIQQQNNLTNLRENFKTEKLKHDVVK